MRYRSPTDCNDTNCHCHDKQELVHILSGDHTHDVVEHGDHYDVVMNGHLHHVNNAHFDYHGIYDPSVNKPVGNYMMNIRKLMWGLLEGRNL